MAPPDTSTLDAFEYLACGGNDVLSEVGTQLLVADLARSLCVCKAWRVLLDGSPHIWRALCKQLWADKACVPALLRTMSEGDFPSSEANARAEQQERESLMALKIQQLKSVMRSLRMQVSVGELVEKRDFADAIIEARRNAADGVTVLLRRPWMLVKANESLPKAALRLSLQDAGRLRITEEELVECVFSVRLRNDGPLAHGMHLDPWWRGKGYGEARFTHDGRVRFTWPTDLDDPDAGAMNPFAALGMGDVSLGWELQMSGSLVQLIFHEMHGGPQEVVCRHVRRQASTLDPCWLIDASARLAPSTLANPEFGGSRLALAASHMGLDPLLRRHLLDKLAHASVHRA